MIRLAVAFLAALLAIAPAVAQMPTQDDLTGVEAPGGTRWAARLLRAAPVFAALPDDAINILAAQTESRLMSIGQLVVHEGDATDSLYVLAAGRFVALREGRTLASLKVGEIIGEYALLTGAPRTATVRAMEDSLVFELPRIVLAPTLRAYPQVITAMAAQMAERLKNNDPQGPSQEDLTKELEQAARTRLGL